MTFHIDSMLFFSSSAYIIGIFVWYIYEKITSGRELNTPSIEISKFFAATSKLEARLGVTDLLTRQTNTIQRMMKMLITNDPNEVNLSALNVLGKDTGKIRTKLNKAAQKI